MVVEEMVEVLRDHQLQEQLILVAVVVVKTMTLLEMEKLVEKELLY